jgi:hypothetical protein
MRMRGLGWRCARARAQVSSLSAAGHRCDSRIITGQVDTEGIRQPTTNHPWIDFTTSPRRLPPASPADVEAPAQLATVEHVDATRRQPAPAAREGGWNWQTPFVRHQEDAYKEHQHNGCDGGEGRQDLPCPAAHRRPLSSPQPHEPVGALGALRTKLSNATETSVCAKSAPLAHNTGSGRSGPTCRAESKASHCLP